MMEIKDPAVRLSLYLGESSQWEGKPLYEALVLKAREEHLAGATVLRGPMGFGKSSRLHTAKILQLSMDLPVVVEIIDERGKVEAFLERIGAMLGGGLATLEEVRVVHYQGRE